MKSRFFIMGMLVTVLVFGITAIGCTTTRHNVEISNVPVSNIREINIRNAGTSYWGANMVKNMQNIDRSIFSETVDIRVVDTNGIVYSKYNVPFGDAAFVETNRERYFGIGTNIILVAASAAVLVPILVLRN